MPIQYDRDDANRRAVIAITGPFDSAEVFEVLARHRAEGGWTYGLLYDLRRTVGMPTKDTLKEFVRTLGRRPGESPRGPVAILTPDPATYAMACSYAAMARANAVVEVFRDKDEADTWLKCQT